jgi:monoamine oxidase
MFASLSKKAQAETLFESPVTAISYDSHKEHMVISINGVQSPQEYAAVISTVPLPRLSLMDLRGANINDNYAQWSAIRELQYGPSIKIGIKFSKPWWAEKQPEFPNPIHGGQSYTDLPIRTM